MPRLFCHCAVLCCLLLAFADVAHGTSAAEYRRMAERCVAAGDYAGAAENYRNEAAIYRKLGDLNGAKVEEMKAERWSTEIAMFIETPPRQAELQRNDTGAKFEPVYGCYLGAYLESDQCLTRTGGNRDEVFAKLVGKKLGVCYDYCRYGQEFPLAWARELCRHGVAPQIAWEPESLHAVRDDAYLRRFARAAASCGGPLFLRYACEMNGDWTPYHDNPELYKEKFRLVHDVFARLAPNVAMIWCVNHIPEQNIARYYPGDQYVDWVGVNFYSVYYHDNHRNRPASFESPASYLKYVYQHYAAKKPIAVCEYGATHRDTVDRVDRSAFAAAKLMQLFTALPRLYPRVKMVDLFDCNNIACARAGRQLNNYCVTDSPQVLAALKQAVAPEYFLSAVAHPRQTTYPTYLKRLMPGMTITGNTVITAWVKSYTESPAIIYQLDGHPLKTITTPGEYRMEIDTDTLTAGTHTFALLVRDANGKTAGKAEVPVLVR